ncbi:MAG: chorismate mutase [Nanobdellota archaeon]
MEIQEARQNIDKIDNKIVKLLAKRMSFMPEIAIYKKKQEKSITNPEREKQILNKKRNIAKENNLNPGFIENIFNLIFKESKQIQKKTLKK